VNLCLRLSRPSRSRLVHVGKQAFGTTESRPAQRRATPADKTKPRNWAGLRAKNNF